MTGVRWYGLEERWSVVARLEVLARLEIERLFYHKICSVAFYDVSLILCSVAALFNNNNNGYFQVLFLLRAHSAFI